MFGGLTASGILGISLAELKKRSKLDKTHVSIIKTEGYSLGNLEGFIENAISSVERAEGVVFKKGETVLIKPSLIEARDPLESVTTHPRVVEGLIYALTEREVGRIIIAEGSGNEKDIDFLLRKTGFEGMIKESGAEFIDLNYADVIKIDIKSPLAIKEVFLPKILFQVDKIVSVPKLKTHRWAGVTLGMKNLFGIVPGSIYGFPKNMLHWAGIPEAIVDLNSAIKIDLSLVDGIMGMEGDGPLEGRPKNLNLLMAGVDPLAVDATATRIMGFDPLKIPQFIYAYRKGMGKALEEEIEVVGVPIESVKTRFEPSGLWKDLL